MPHIRRCRAALLVAGIGLCPLAAQARDYIAAAREAVQAGDLKTAEIELRNAVRADPQNADNRFSLARVELILGDAAGAERDAAAAQERGYDPHLVLPLLGEALLAQNRADDVLARFQVKGEDHKLDAEILLLRGEAQARIGQFDAAQASFAEAKQSDPSMVRAWVADATLALARGDTAAAAGMADHALAMQPKSVEALVLKARVMRARGEVAGSLALLGMVIADNPTALEARLDRAETLIATGKGAAAKPDIDAVLKLMPGNVQALFLRAVSLHEAHDDKTADLVLEKLSAILPRFPRGYLLLAAVKERLGELAQAEDAIAKHIARDPDDPTGYKLLAQIDLEKGRPDLAIVPLTQAIAAGKADVATHVMLGRAYAATGQPAQAAESLKRAEAMAPTDIAVRTELAASLIRSGHPNEAMADLERTLALAPKQPAVGEALVFAAINTGDLSKADRALAEVRAAAGGTAVTQNLAGAVQLAKLDVKGARATFESDIRENPDFTPAKANLARVMAMQGQQADADKVLSGILKKSPTAEPALSMLTAAMLHDGRAGDAMALLERAHDAAPTNLALTVRLADAFIRTGSPQKALDLTRQAVEEVEPGSIPATGSLPALLAGEAAAQIVLKQANEARATLNRLLEIDPRATQVRQQLAELMVQAGDYEAARNVIKAGIRIRPRDYQLYLDYALTDLKAGGLASALSTAEALRQQDQGFEMLAALAGDVYLAANKPDEAVKAYQAAAAAAPSNMFVVRIATALQRAGKPDEARQALATWLAKNPDDLSVATLLSELDITLKRYDDAQVELRAILAKQPRSAVTLNNLAWVDQLRGDTQAQPLAERAYLLAPSPETADTLGWILTRGGQAAKGAPLLREASTGGDPRIAYHLAVALKDLGEREESVKVLHAVVAAQGEFDEKTQAQHLLGEMGKS